MNGKIVFHCSAGIGRTGTIIAIYNIVESLRILLGNDAETQSSNEPRISIFGVVRRLREQRYCMVQSISQYEFIYEYILDYLSSKGLVELKFPRNAFGLEEDELEGNSADEDNQKGPDGLHGQGRQQEAAAYDFEANDAGKHHTNSHTNPTQTNPAIIKPPPLLIDEQHAKHQAKEAKNTASEDDPKTPVLALPSKRKTNNKCSKLSIDGGFE